MPLIELILMLAVVGFVLWLVTTYIPMDAKIKQLIVIAVVVILVLWLLAMFFPGLGNISVGRIR